MHIITELGVHGVVLGRPIESQPGDAAIINRHLKGFVAHIVAFVWRTL
jgi:hypothetical protein